MGMEVGIWKARTVKAFEAENWYGSEQVEEVYYARKFYDLIQQVSFIKNEDEGEFIRLTKDQVEELIVVATHNEDYWGGFDSVPMLCKILRDFDDEEERGYHYYLNFG